MLLHFEGCAWSTPRKDVLILVVQKQSCATNLGLLWGIPDGPVQWTPQRKRGALHQCQRVIPGLHTTETRETANSYGQQRTGKNVNTQLRNTFFNLRFVGVCMRDKCQQMACLKTLKHG